MDGHIGDARLEPPDLIDYVVGVRTFNREGHYLSSPFQGGRWKRPYATASCKPDERATAQALRAIGLKSKDARTRARAALQYQRELEAHGVPGVGCSCGLYAYHAVEDIKGQAPIIGVVRAKGKLVVHAHGLRAEQLEVVALGLDGERAKAHPPVQEQRFEEVARRAAAFWQIPLFTTVDALNAALPEFGSPVPEELRPKEEQDDVPG
jgi:hypothetical protein